MKTVLLLRHAKSSWDEPSLPDHQRPLAPRGQKAAPRVGKYMAKEGLIPDRVLCSSAARAAETWHLVQRELGSEVHVEVREDLYHASSASVLTIIQDLPDAEEVVLLVGHNPTFESLAYALAGSGDHGALSELRVKYPTGALAILDFPTERWMELRSGTGVLRAFIKPRDLKS